MKQSFYILFATGTSAIAGTLFAWMCGGRQEDAGSAIGGVVGFAIANGVVTTFCRSKAAGESYNQRCSNHASTEAGFTYGVFAIAYFAFVGWLTGYLHDHGAFAGTVCGGLGGFIVAIIVPTLYRSSFMAARRKLQLSLSAVALGALLAIVWAMYKHEFL